MASNKPTVKEEIMSGTTCPRCFIGKRHLENTMKNFQSSFNFNIEWKPFLLQADTPEKGVSALQYHAEKNGQPLAADAKSGKSPLYEAGLRVGINSDVNRPFVNSIKSHRSPDNARLEEQKYLEELMFDYHNLIL